MPLPVGVDKDPLTAWRPLRGRMQTLGGFLGYCPAFSASRAWRLTNGEADVVDLVAGTAWPAVQAVCASGDAAVPSGR